MPERNPPRQIRQGLPRLVPIRDEPLQRRPGRLAGRVDDAFFDPLPEEEPRAWVTGAMRLLLDTHALLWWFTDDPRLSPRARGLIGDMNNEVLVSAASAWEIATKHRLGKLEEAADVIPRFDELIAAAGFTHLAASHHHGLRAGAYRTAHRDPIDRMLAAQAAIETLPRITCDPAFGQFEITTLW